MTEILGLSWNESKIESNANKQVGYLRGGRNTVQNLLRIFDTPFHFALAVASYYHYISLNVFLFCLIDKLDHEHRILFHHHDHRQLFSLRLFRHESQCAYHTYLTIMKISHLNSLNIKFICQGLPLTHKLENLASEGKEYRLTLTFVSFDSQNCCKINLENRGNQ